MRVCWTPWSSRNLIWPGKPAPGNACLESVPFIGAACRAAGASEQRGAECPARIAGGRLDPDVFERALAEQPTVGDTVERDAAGQDQILIRSSRDVAAHSQHDVFGDGLDARRQVHVPLLDTASRDFAAVRQTDHRTDGWSSSVPGSS